jgi:hypothetical protein
MYKKYEVTVKLLSPMLGTVSVNPDVYAKHIIAKQNELIEKFAESKAKSTSKYAGESKITPEEAAQELEWLLDKVEEFIGRRMDPDERVACLKDSKKFFKSIGADESQGLTGFFYDKEKNLPFIGGWMIGGFLKNAAEILTRDKNAGKEESSKKDGSMWSSITASKKYINDAVSIQRKIYFDRDIIRNEDGKPQMLTRSLRAKTADGPRVCLASSEQVDEGACLSFTIRTLPGLMPEKTLRELFEYGNFKGLGQWRNADWGQIEVVSFKEVE